MVFFNAEAQRRRVIYPQIVFLPFRFGASGAKMSIATLCWNIANNNLCTSALTIGIQTQISDNQCKSVDKIRAGLPPVW